jgi:dCMP deaminase
LFCSASLKKNDDTSKFTQLIPTFFVTFVNLSHNPVFLSNNHQSMCASSKDNLTEKQRLLDQRYLAMAAIWAQNSYCKRRQVGALLVKDKMIISDGYNGTPSGFENQCEDENNVTKPYVLHAEANAITKVARSNNSSDDATLYVTSSPCIECAKLIIQAGIIRVVFSDNYRVEDGVQLLRRADIEVVQVNQSAQ